VSRDDSTLAPGDDPKQASGDLPGLTIVPLPPPAATWTLPGPWQASQPVSPTLLSAMASLACVEEPK